MLQAPDRVRSMLVGMQNDMVREETDVMRHFPAGRAIDRSPS